MRWLFRHLVSGVCFALTLSTVAGGLRHVWPRWGMVSILREKLAHLQAHPAEYDTLFVGSSRVYRHIDPVLFDALTAAAGAPTRSFNAGLDAMFAAEDSGIVETILARPRPGLKRVFLEPGSFNTAAARRDFGSSRSLSWHDWPRTLFITRELWAQPGGSTARGAEILRHWQSWSVNETNVGRGAELLLPLLAVHDRKLKEIPPILWLGSGGNGFIPHEGTMDEVNRQTFRKYMADRASGRVREQTMDALEQANFQHIVELVRHAGAEVILIIPPNPAPTTELPASSLGARVLDFSDIHRWPQLFREEDRQDCGHLNANGAKAFTEALVEEWLHAGAPAERR